MHADDEKWIQNFWVENPKGGDHSQHQRVDKNIELKQIQEKMVREYGLDSSALG